MGDGIDRALAILNQEKHLIETAIAALDSLRTADGDDSVTEAT